MQVSVSNTNGLERQMTVTLPADQIEQEVSKRLSKLRKTARLPGFRPGKIPANVIDKKFGSDVLHEIASEMINRSYVEALIEQKIEPATPPVIKPSDISRGQDIEYTATFNVFPDVSRTDLNGVSVETRTCEIIEEDIDHTINTIRKQRLDWNPVEAPAAEGNRVRIDFKGMVDGELFEGGEGSDYPVVIGEGALLKDFETGMVGMTTGETKIVDVAFPEDYPAENLAGKRAQFEITVNEVAESKMPEVNEEFIKSLGIEEGSVESFRAQVRENMERELKSRNQAFARDKVLTALLDINEMDLPTQLIDEEIAHIKQANADHMKQQGLDAASMDIDDDKFREEAVRRVKLSVIVREVIGAHKLKVDKPMIEQRLAEIAQTYDDKDAYMRWYVQDKQRMQELESATLEQLVVDTLLGTADEVEKKVSFRELMNIDKDA